MNHFKRIRLYAITCVPFLIFHFLNFLSFFYFPHVSFECKLSACLLIMSIHLSTMYNSILLFRCPSYNNVPSNCKMITDPNDNCCLVPQCNVFTTPSPVIFQPGTGPTVNGQNPSTTPAPIIVIPTYVPAVISGSSNNNPNPGTSGTSSKCNIMQYWNLIIIKRVIKNCYQWGSSFFRSWNKLWMLLLEIILLILQTSCYPFIHDP